MDIKNHNNEDSLDAKNNDDDFKSQFYQYYELTSVARNLLFYISEAIDDPRYYVDMIHRIKSASSRDVIYLYINSPGGSLSTGVQLINAMHSSQAKTVTVLEAEASSMGAIIFLAGDEFIVNDNCLIMFHNFNGVIGGKGHEVLAQATATVDWYSKIMKKICYPFLSLEEISKVLKGEDIWLHSEEIRIRLTKMVDDLNKKPKTKTKKKPSKKKETAKQKVVKEK